MPTARTAAQQSASRTNGARSRGPVSEAGKARSARNGTRHGLRGGPFALLPGEDREEFAALHATVAADWGPRDNHERRWLMELVTSLWRQDRQRALELATTRENPPNEATMKRLVTFARYGARIDKDIGRALHALRTLRNRPDAWIDEQCNGTSEPGETEPQQQNCTNELPRTSEPDLPQPHDEKCTNEFPARTAEPEPACPAPGPAAPLNRHQRRRLAALSRNRRAASAGRCGTSAQLTRAGPRWNARARGP